MKLKTRVAQRLKELQDMLNSLGLWQGDSEDRINIEKKAIISFKNELKEILDIDANNDGISTEKYHEGIYINIMKLIQEIESVENH